jgi:hypothetical protein
MRATKRNQQREEDVTSGAVSKLSPYKTCQKINGHSDDTAEQVGLLFRALRLHLFQFNYETVLILLHLVEFSLLGM